MEKKQGNTKIAAFFSHTCLFSFCFLKSFKLRVLFEKYARAKGRPGEGFKFFFDGEPLDADLTPSEADMEEDDLVVDVVEVSSGEGQAKVSV